MTTSCSSCKNRDEELVLEKETEYRDYVYIIREGEGAPAD
jgi:hypothetical protein